MSSGLPGGDIVCDGLKVINLCGLIVINETLVTDEQGGSVMVIVFLLSHKLRRFFLNCCFPPFLVPASPQNSSPNISSRIMVRATPPHHLGVAQSVPLPGPAMQMSARQCEEQELGAV